MGLEPAWGALVWTLWVSEVRSQILTWPWTQSLLYSYGLKFYLLKLSSYLPLCFAGQRDPARRGIHKVKPLGQEQPFCPPCGPVRCVIRVAAVQNKCLPRSREKKKCAPCLHHGSLSLLPRPGIAAPTYNCAEYPLYHCNLTQGGVASDDVALLP